MNDPLNEHIDPELLVRFLSEDADEQEKNRVQQWINADNRNKEYVDEMIMLWESGKNAKDFTLINTKEDWGKVKRKIIDKDKIKKVSQVSRRKHFIYKLARVAAVVTILLSAYYYWPFLTTYLNDTTTIVAVENQLQTTLPDGSQVYLNKNAQLTFPKSFADKSREVELVGEAFFEVKENANKPFLIRSEKAITEVVGTSFNVNSSVVDSVVVTVLTGMVFLYETNQRTEKIELMPGEQGQLIKGKGLLKSINDDVNFLSWKTGELVFHNTSIKKVIDDLNRHYHQNIELDASLRKEYTLTAKFKQQDLEEVLTEMKLVLPIQIQKEQNRIIISAEI
ncbi:MAG: FecR domain-containing protein [Bacteroidota bacterium]